MKIQTNNKLTLAVSVLLLSAGQMPLVQADDKDVYYEAPQPQTGQNYGQTDNLTPGYTQPYYQGGNYGRGYNSSPWGGSGPSFRGPWNSGRGGNSMPWSSGRGGNSMPWSSRRGGPSFSDPWSSGRGGNSMPWDRGRDGRSMPWNSGRGGWMNKDKFGDAWDDMLNAPSDMGEMPGGWTAPSVSVPNPVDVGDEFGDASRDVPDQMRNVYDDNRRSK